MECTDRANVYAKRLEIRNVREIEAERDPARQIIASGQKQPRDTDDIIGALHRDICTIDPIYPARHSVDDDDGHVRDLGPPRSRSQNARDRGHPQLNNVSPEIVATRHRKPALRHNGNHEDPASAALSCIGGHKLGSAWVIVGCRCAGKRRFRLGELWE